MSKSRKETKEIKMVENMCYFAVGCNLEILRYQHGLN